MDFSPLLAELGIDHISANIYLLLLRLGTSSPKILIRESGLSHTSVHDALSLLLAEDLVTYEKVGRRAHYTPVHPQKLLEYVDKKKREMSRLEGETETAIRALAGIYSTALHKPGIQFFEGVEQVKKGVYHSLQSTETIRAFINAEVADRYADLFERDYVETRKKRGLKKQIIMPDTAAAKRYAKMTLDDPLTEVRFISAEKYPFETAVEIYDEYVTFFSSPEGTVFGFFIQDNTVAQFQKAQFDFVWDHAAPIVRSNP